MFCEQYFLAISNPAVQIQELGKHPSASGWTSYTHRVSILQQLLLTAPGQCPCDTPAPISHASHDLTAPSAPGFAPKPSKRYKKWKPGSGKEAHVWQTSGGGTGS